MVVASPNVVWGTKQQSCVAPTYYLILITVPPHAYFYMAIEADAVVAWYDSLFFAVGREVRYVGHRAKS